MDMDRILSRQPDNEQVSKAIMPYIMLEKSEPVRENSLRTFLGHIESDFREYVKQNQGMCELNSLSGYGAHPIYSNINVQQLYLLKSLYINAFEDTEMFEAVFSDRRSAEGLVVESIGCGSAVDSWALNYVAARHHADLSKFSYRGIDSVHWNYQMGPESNQIIRCNAADHYDKTEILDADVYVFPRSIGDFTDSDFVRILRAFGTKPLTRSTIYLLIAKRKKQRVSPIDEKRTYLMANTLHSRGLICTGHEKENELKRQGLECYDMTFQYPQETREFLMGLKRRCRIFRSCPECGDDCSINHQPVLSASRLSYTVLKFQQK